MCGLRCIAACQVMFIIHNDLCHWMRAKLRLYLAEPVGRVQLNLA